MNKIETIIFDMDGTLYQIDGRTTGFVGSSLEAAIFQNALAYIQIREQCDLEMAQAILTAAQADPAGVSRCLSQRYNIERSEYLSQVWRVIPDAIVQNFETAVAIVKQLNNLGIRLILLTAAPAVWQQIVCSFIGLTNEFEEIYTAEMFSSKEEIFLQLAATNDPTTILSVGDQLTTDIEPAQKCGMQALLVTSPTDLQGVLNTLKDLNEKEQVTTDN